MTVVLLEMLDELKGGKSMPPLRKETVDSRKLIFFAPAKALEENLIN